MAKTAVMVRLDPSEIRALDALALKAGLSRATYATSVLKRRLNGSSIIEEPMEALDLDEMEGVRFKEGTHR